VLLVVDASPRVAAGDERARQAESRRVVVMFDMAMILSTFAVRVG